jgi:transposase
MKRGQQKRIPTPGTPQRLHLFGAYEWATDQVACCPADHKTSSTFIAFVEWLMTVCFPDEVVVMVLDNASIHHSYATRAALSLFEHRLLVIWLPPYCSILNLIERFWLHLKDQVCTDTLYPDLHNLITSVLAEIARQNDPTFDHRFRLSKVLQ